MNWYGPLVAAFLTTIAGMTGGRDWPGLRGPNSDGSAAAGSQLFTAEEARLAVAWRATIGSGYSGVVVVAGKAITLFSDGKDDVAAAFDADGGQELWRQPIEATHKGLDGSFDGPMATPAVGAGKVFALGAGGHLVAFDLGTGRVLWRVDLVEREQARKPYFGFGASPVLAGGVLVVGIGADKGRAISGFDPDTGNRKWVLGDDEVKYQTPVVLRVGGREQVVAVGNTKLFGIDPVAGRLLWEHSHEGDSSEIGSGSLVPVPAGEGRLFLKHRSDASTMLKLVPLANGRTMVETLWTAPVLRTTYSVAVYHDGHLYGFNGRTMLTCVDAASGETRWRSREPGEGFPLLVGRDLVVLTKDRTLHVGVASPEGWKELARIEAFRDLVWTPPSFAAGAVFARSLGEIKRIELRPRAEGPAAATARPRPPSRFVRFLQEIEASADKKAAAERFLASVDTFPLVEWPDQVTFLYYGPADDMGIAGDWLGARREDPMLRVPGTDLFWYSGRLEPDVRVSYYFVRNFEEKLPDPRNPTRVPGRLRPGALELFEPVEEMSLLAMPASQTPAHLRDAPLTGRGRMDVRELPIVSRAGAKVVLHAYLPSGHDRSTTPYPVAYVLGGDEAREQGLVPRTLDNLRGRSVAPLIAVFVGKIDWGPVKPRWYEETTVAAAVLATEIVPFVDAQFRTIRERGGRAAVGAGFAGLDATQAVLAHPDVFGMLGTQSLLMIDSDEARFEKMITTPEERPLRLYLDWGRYDLRATREAWDVGETNRRLVAVLRGRGYRPAGGEAPGGFGWGSWRDRTDRVFEALFPR